MKYVHAPAAFSYTNFTRLHSCETVPRVIKFRDTLEQCVGAGPKPCPSKAIPQGKNIRCEHCKAAWIKLCRNHVHGNMDDETPNVGPQRVFDLMARDLGIFAPYRKESMVDDENS